MRTYDVRAWAIWAGHRGTGTSDTVRWAVAGARRSGATHPLLLESPGRPS